MFLVDNTSLEFQLSTGFLSALQVKTLGIFARFIEPLAESNGKISDQIIRFYPIRWKNVHRGLIGVSDTRQAKTYPLLLQAKDSVGHSVLTSFNHLNEIGVNVGDTVEKGRRIGLMQETGQVPGSHLHLGMVVHGGYSGFREEDGMEFLRHKRRRKSKTITVR